MDEHGQLRQLAIRNHGTTEVLAIEQCCSRCDSPPSYEGSAAHRHPYAPMSQLDPRTRPLVVPARMAVVCRADGGLRTTARACAAAPPLSPRVVSMATEIDGAGGVAGNWHEPSSSRLARES